MQNFFRLSDSEAVWLEDYHGKRYDLADRFGKKLVGLLKTKAELNTIRVS